MKTRWMLVIVLAAATARGVEAPKTADDILKFASAKNAGYKTWSAEMRQSVSLMGVPMTLQGQTWFKQPRLTRTEMQMPMVGALGKMTIVMGADGILWQEMEMLGQKKVMKMNLHQVAANLTGQSGAALEPMQNPDPVHQWEKSRQFMDFTLLPGATIGGQPMWALEGRWKQGAITNAAMSQQAASVGKIRLHIGQQDGFSHRVEQFDKEGARPVVTVDLSKVKFNEPLDDAKFQYKPPPGIEAIDVTDMTAEFMRQGGPTPPPAPAGKP